MKSRRTSLSMREKLLKRQRKSLGTLGESTKNLCRTDREMQSQQDGPLLIPAVDRMQPGGRRYAAAGSIFQAAEVESRSVAPQFMEEILQRVRLLFQPQTGNFEHKIGTVKIITNSKGSVVTIMIYQ